VPAVGGPQPEPKPLPSPAHILFVYADPVDENPVPWAETRALLLRDFGAEAHGRLALEVVEGTRDGLAGALQRRAGVDVLHFIGHGRTLGGVGQLLLTGRDGAAVPVSSSWLAGLLRGRDVRLVVLTACDSATGDHAADFAVLATALVRSGVPAVVANQFPVRIETVAPFVRALYAELLRSGDVDRAVNEGRVRLSADLSPPDDVFEWGIPTLHRRLGAARVFVP
jgi:CHAT domain